MKSHFSNLIRPYAGWVALALLVVAIFSSVISATFAFPLLLLLLAGTLAAFRYWDELNTFDVWALDEWVRTRSDSVGVREWYSPHQAADLFCSPVVVGARNDAAAEMNTIMMDLIRNPRPDSPGAGLSMPAASGRGQRMQQDQHDAAQIRYHQCNAALSRELLAQLRHGVLLAKGMLEKDDVARAERFIPTARWRIMDFDIEKGSAFGQGWNYTGIIIGKKPIAAPQPAPRMPVQKAPAQRRRR